jgi:hypothetical protein
MKKSKTFSLRERALLVKLETTMFGLTKTHKEISAERRHPGTPTLLASGALFS